LTRNVFQEETTMATRNVSSSRTNPGVRIGTPQIILLAVAALLLGAGFHGPAFAQDTVQPTVDQLGQLRALLTAYEDVDAALADGFEQFGECMSGPQGAQGIHYTHGARIDDPGLDPLEPEVLMYEPRPDGSLRLIGAEYLVFQRAWHDAGTDASPALLGREFYLNTTLLDEPFYALHAWVWQHNPLGMFANWNPLVSCESAKAYAH
jgi:hypothetical protein